MKSVLLALTTCGFVLVSCNKVDGGAGGPGVEIPNFGLVGPAGFKNTATSTSEVASHLRESSNSTGQVVFGGSKSQSSESSPSSLDSLAVKSFLAGEAMDLSSPSLSVPTEGSDCASSLNGLNSVVSTTSSALKQAADVLVNLDSSQLPDGIVKEPASDQYAVSYAVDLSKMKVETSSSSSGENRIPSGGDYGSGLSLPSQGQAPQMQVTGLARFGAGANDELAILGLGYNATMAADGNSLNGSGGFSVGAYSKQQKLMMHLTTDVTVAMKDPQGGLQSGRLSVASSAALIAGNSPSIEFSLNGSANGTISGLDGNETEGSNSSDSSSSNSRHSVDFDGKNHSIAANVKIAKLSNNDVAFTMSVKADGKEQQSNLVLTADASGHCVVKQPGVSTLANAK